MRIDRSHFPWIVFTVVATLAAGVLYLAAQHEDASDPFKFLGVTVALPDFFREAAHRRNTGDADRAQDRARGAAALSANPH